VPYFQQRRARSSPNLDSNERDYNCREQGHVVSNPEPSVQSGLGVSWRFHNSYSVHRVDVVAVAPKNKSVAHARDRLVLALFRMRRTEVRKLVESVGVRLKAVGRDVTLGEESEAVIDDIVGEDAVFRATFSVASAARIRTKGSSHHQPKKGIVRFDGGSQGTRIHQLRKQCLILRHKWLLGGP